MTAYEQLTIETPEQIALEFTLASVGSRFLAIVVDTLIQVAVALLVLLIVLGVIWTLGTGAPSRTAAIWLFAVVLLVGFCLFYGYFALFEILWRGQTPGKRLVGLRVIGASGRPMTPFQALLRNLLRIVDQLPGLYAIGILFVLVTSRNQRLGDLAASTVVVHERPSAAESPQVVQGDDVGRARRSSLRANRLSDQEVALVERFLERRADLDVNVRERTAREIANRIRARLDLAPGAGDQDEELLMRVLAEYRESGGYR